MKNLLRSHLAALRDVRALARHRAIGRACLSAVFPLLWAGLAQAAGPTVTETFSPSTLPLNGAGSYTVSIHNPSATETLTGVQFSVTIAGAFFTGVPTDNNCFSGGVGGSALGVSPVSIGPGGTCTITLPIQASQVGFHTTPLTVTSDQGSTSTSATLSVTELPSLIVTTTADVVDNLDGQTSLREALAYAAVLGGSQAITFANTTANGEAVNFYDGNPHTITLGGTELSATSSVTITGPGAEWLTVSGNNASRVLHIAYGPTVTVSGLTLTRGQVDSSTFGAGIWNLGTLRLEACALTDNHVVYNGSSDANAGGLLNDYGATLEVVDCLVEGNSAFYGAGLYNFGQMTVTQSTLSGNNAGVFGGGILSWGQTALRFVTLANNSGSGLFDSGFGTTYEHCVFDSNPGGNVNSFYSGTSLGYNLSSDATGNFTATGDLPNTPALLGPLADNGGPTWTHALLAGSPALNGGDPAFDDTPLPHDQRGPGFPRVAFGRVDIGAFESQGIAPLITCPADIATPNDAGYCWASETFSVTATGFPTPTVVCTLGGSPITSPHDFPVGTNVVTCTATSDAGTATCTFTVVVTDTEPPTVQCPANIFVGVVTPQSVNVTWTATAADNCDPSPAVICTPPSGSAFPLGTTPVSCSAVSASAPTCVVPDNGSGTATLPPAGCAYRSPDDVWRIIDGLPPGSTLDMEGVLQNFVCPLSGGGVCSFVYPVPGVQCYQAGGSLGGEQQCADAALAFTIQGTGVFAGYNRALNLPLSLETHTAPRTPFQPVQSFDAVLSRLFGQITGDPDFDLLRITGGTDFGLPSPGHTTLTQLPGPNWAVDSFFDITYRIDFIGAPGGPFAGRSGSTTGTIRMQTGTPPLVSAPCGFTVTVCATNIVVLNNHDAGPGSLRQAIADLCPGGTITFDPSLNGQTITLTSGELVADKDMTILGPGADLLAVSGNLASRIFHLLPGQTAAISGLTLTQGHVDGPVRPDDHGGGILSAGSLTLSDCVLTGHVSGGMNRGDGAALYHYGPGLALWRCVFQGNLAQGGGYGASAALDGGTISVNDCTFSGNAAEGNAGGIVNYSSVLTATNCTFSGNSAINGAAVIQYWGTATLSSCTVVSNAVAYSGGGIEHVGRTGSSFALLNCLVAHNTTLNLGPDAFSYMDQHAGPFTSLGHNLIGNGDGALNLVDGVNGDQVGTLATPINPLLGPLADNGGPTWTHALLVGSPALNGGDPAFDDTSLPHDQRGPGYPRVAFGRVDIGAFESQGIAPLITCPADIATPNDAGLCSASVSFAVTATGFPAPTVECTLGGVSITSPHVFPVGLHSVTCTATNEVGTNTCTFSVTVRDAEPPTLACAPPRTVECAVTAWAFEAPTATNDNCAVVSTTILSTVTNLGLGGTFTATRTWVATDLNGNTTTCAQTVTVADTTPPTIVCYPAKTVACDGAVVFDPPVGIELCGNVYVTVVSTVTNLGPGLDYSVTRTWRASDVFGNSADCSQTITVHDGAPPALTCGLARTVECGEAWSFDAPSASDACGSVTISLLATTTNAACGDTFTATRTWQASDTSGNTATCSQTVTVQDTTAPTLTCAPAKSAECGAAWSFDEPTASDTCGSVSVSVVDTVSTPACGDTFSATRTWQAEDACGNVATCSQTVMVRDTTPPTLSCAPAKSAECGAAWAFDAPLGASDGCGSVSVSVLSTVTNAGCGLTYTAVRTWQAVDACGNTGTCAQTVNVVDTTPPTLSCAPAKSVACGTAWAFNPPTGFESCGSLSVTVVGTVIEGCVQTRTWRATDACGNSSQCSQTVTVVDAAAPVLTCAPNVTVQPGDTWAFTPPSVSDNCDAAPGGVIVSTVTNSGPGGTWSATRTWQASDACGNASQCSQTVWVGTPFGRVSGRVQLQGFLGTNTLPTPHTRVFTFVATTNHVSGTNVLKTWTLSLSNGGGDTFDYELTDVPPEANGLSVKTAWNQRRKLGFAFDAGLAAVVDYVGADQLRAGDMTGDNVVNLPDYSLLITYWLPPWNDVSVTPAAAAADLDGSGFVNVWDYGLLGGAWFTTGDPE